MNNSLRRTISCNRIYRSLNKTMERRTDFDMKAIEPAEVVDVSGGDCEDEGSG
ncbi:unnamed protein product [Hymenolepis diminuta]|uniref:Uncharacterized protein n=1 Tax=Hymenolepis diminuta TaxID=6216 RepID=A0A564Z780_HYMDI|nr:unnamed protein product [Hymenolepis diminuta]